MENIFFARKKEKDRAPPRFRLYAASRSMPTIPYSTECDTANQYTLFEVARRNILYAETAKYATSIITDEYFDKSLYWNQYCIISAAANINDKL